MNSSHSGAASPQPAGQPVPRHGHSKRLAAVLLADILRRNWLALLLRAFLAVAFGVLVLVLFKGYLQDLISPFGVYAFADGVLGLAIALGENKGLGRWRVLFLQGLAGIGVGILTFLYEPGNLLHFMLYIGLWAAATGVLHVMTAVFLRGKLRGGWLLVVLGIISVAFGIAVVAVSGAYAMGLLGAVDVSRVVVPLSRVIAVYCFVFAVLLGILAFLARATRLR